MCSVVRRTTSGNRQKSVFNDVCLFFYPGTEQLGRNVENLDLDALQNPPSLEFLHGVEANDSNDDIVVYSDRKLNKNQPSSTGTLLTRVCYIIDMWGA